MNLLRPTGNTFPLDPSSFSIPAFDTGYRVHRTGLKDGGFAEVRVGKSPSGLDRLLLDRFDENGVKIGDDVLVTGGTAGRRIYDAGVVDLGEGELGAWWTHLNTDTYMSSVVYKRIGADNSLGPFKVVTGTSNNTSTYKMNAFPLETGEVMFVAELALNTIYQGPQLQPDSRIIAITTDKDGNTTIPFRYLANNSGARDFLDGAIQLSDGKIVVVQSTVRSSEYEVDPNLTEFGSIVNVTMQAQTFNALGEFSTIRGLYEGLQYSGRDFSLVAPIGDGFGAYVVRGRFKETFRLGDEFVGILEDDGSNFDRFNENGAVVSNNPIEGEYPIVISGFSGGDVAYGFFNRASVDNPASIQFFDFDDQPIGTGILPDVTANAGIEFVVSGQSLLAIKPVFSDKIDYEATQYDLVGISFSPDVIPETAEGGYVVGELRAVNLRPETIASVSLSGADSGDFNLTPDHKLVLKEGASVDHEADPVENLILTFTCTDGSTLTVDYDLPVLDVNEAPTEVRLSRTSFKFDPISSTEFAIGQVLATFAAEDPDFGDILTYSLNDDAGGLFAIAGDKLVVNNALALSVMPTPQTFMITAKATDLGGLDREQTFQLRFVAEDKPYAFDDAYRFAKDQEKRAVSIDVLKNDLSPAADVDLSSLKILAAPDEGSASVRGGKISYTPGAAGWKATEFTYTFKDQDGTEAAPAMVKIRPKSLLPDPYVASIDLVDLPDKGYAEATGDFTFGRSDGTEALLRIEGGTIRAYVDQVEVTNATVYSAVGLVASPGLAKPLFKGGFVLNAASGVATITDTVAADVVRGDDYEPGGLELTTSAIKVAPNGLFVAGKLSLPASLGSAPLDFGALTGGRVPTFDSFRIDAGGFDAVGVSVTFPDVKGLKLPFLPPNISLETKGVAVSYSPVTDTFKLQGILTANDDLFEFMAKPSLKSRPFEGGLEGYGAAKIALDLSGQNFIQFRDDPITGLQLTGKGTIALGKVQLGGGFSLENFALTYGQTDTATTIGGKLTVGLPGVFGAAKGIDTSTGQMRDPAVKVGGELELVVSPALDLNKIALSLDGARIPIPQLPFSFIDKLAVGASNLSRNAAVNPTDAPLTLEGSVGMQLSYGPFANYTFPAWLGLKNDKGQPITELPDLSRLDLTGKMQIDPRSGDLAFGGKATFNVISDKLFTATVASVPGAAPNAPDKPLVNLSTGAILAAGSFSFGSFFSGSGKIKGDLLSAKSETLVDPSGSANVPFVAASATGLLKFPNVAALGRFAGKDFANATFYMHVDADQSLANDSFGVQASISLARGLVQAEGFQVFGDGTVHLLQAGEFLPQVGSWTVPAGLSHITMSAEWENAAVGPIPVIVTYRESEGGPVLATYTEAEFAANGIEVVANLTGDFGKTVIVFDPRPGVWDIEVIDGAGLGAIRESAMGPQEQATFDFTRIDRVENQGDVGVTVAVDMGGAGADALVDIFVDEDGEGYDGVLAAGSLTLAEAKAGIIWNGGDADGERAHVYAVLRDAAKGVVFSPYAQGSVDLAAEPAFARFADGTFSGASLATAPAFAATLAEASPGQAVDVISEARHGDIGRQIVSVDDLVVRADGAGFKAIFDLDPNIARFSLAGGAAMDVDASRTNGVFVLGGPGDNAVVGGRGDDILVSGGGTDLLEGRGGQDLLFAGSGPVTLDGGDGFDVLFLTGDDAFVFDLKDPSIVTATGSRLDLVFADGVATIEALVGARAGDQLTGDARGNWLYGLGGNDSLVGLAGDDALDGGDGDDTLDGGEGSDLARYDLSYAAVVVDLRIAGPQDTGGAGRDTFVAAPDGRASIEHLVGSAAASGDRLTGDVRNNMIFGLGGADTLAGEAGDDQLFGGLGDDVLDGGSGFDYARFDLAASSPVRADLTHSEPQVTGQGGDAFVFDGDVASIEGLVGTNLAGGGDVLIGDRRSNVLFALDGDDTLDGGGADDYLFGGAGADVFVFRADFGQDQIFDFNVGQDMLRFDGGALSALANIRLVDLPEGVLVEADNGLVVLRGVSSGELAGVAYASLLL